MKTFKPDTLVFVKIVPTLKLMCVDPVIFKIDAVEPAKLFILFICVFSVDDDDNMLFPATDKDV